MKIGIFGGSFNPIHNMHVKIATYLIKKEFVNKIIFVPTGDYYSYKPNMIKGKYRLDMINLAIKKYPNLSSSDFELQDKMIYTYETLNYFQKKYPNDTIYFICGTDNINYLDSWKKPEEIKKIPILVIKRKKEKIKPEILKKENITYINMRCTSISSTKIREKIFQKKKIQKYVPKQVETYIYQKKLYRKEKNYV